MIAFALSTALLCSALAADDSMDVADAGAPVGANLPSSFALGPVELTPQLDLFGSFEGDFPADAKSYNRFAVPRALAGLEVHAEGVRGRLLVEGVYSTEGGALIGTAGDSEVIRLREAWGGYRWRFLEARLGVIPDPQFAPLEHAWAFRQLAPDGLEAFHLASPADFGASLRGWLPADFGWVALAITNGEGYGQRELNTGKNLTLAANVRPVPALKQLEVVATGVLGSSGVGNTRADRLGGGVLWDGGWVGAGVTAHAFWGLADDGGRRGLLLQAFARVQLFERLLLAVRGEHLWRDFSATADDSVSTLAAGAGVRLGYGCELFAEYERDALSPLARASLPGADVNAVRVVVRLNPFLSQLEDWR